MDAIRQLRVLSDGSLRQAGVCHYIYIRNRYVSRSGWYGDDAGVG